MVFLLVTDRSCSRKLLINPKAVKTIRPIIVDKLESGCAIEFLDKTKLEIVEAFDEVTSGIDPSFNSTSYS